MFCWSVAPDGAQAVGTAKRRSARQVKFTTMRTTHTWGVFTL
ncbi:MAG TPA: hypothetical protein VH540_15585 [Ktedonobacterales bacterium]